MPDLRVVASVVDAGTPSARLVAWMTGAQLPDHADATAAVAQVLPAHMRPILVMVDGFPRTAGGKIDKAALPVPEVAVHPAPVLDGDDTLVRDASAIMANLLGSPDVGADQSFYDLGGHSLLMIDLVGRLETLAGLRLGPTEIYENRTPRHIAHLLRKGSDTPKHIIPIQQSGARPPLFACIF